MNEEIDEICKRKKTRLLEVHRRPQLVRGELARFLDQWSGGPLMGTTVIDFRS